MKVTQEQVKRILDNKGASMDYTTGKDTTKKGYCISIKDTETQLKDVYNYTIEELTQRINTILESNAYNEELNKKNVLGFWINEDGILFIDNSKILNVNDKNIYKVKNEALINNQYSVYNNITGKTYNIIIPIYTLYNTADLLGYINADNITGYSIDFYNLQDIGLHLNVEREGLNHYIFNSIDDIPTDYNYNKVIIKDTSNFTRDILEDDINLSIEDAFKLSRLIEA